LLRLQYFTQSNAIGGSMNRQSGVLVIVAAIALAAAAIAPARAADWNLPLFGLPDVNLKALFGGGNSAPQPLPPPPLDLAPPAPPTELAAPLLPEGAYVPVAPPGMVTYPGYTAAYPNTGCRGAYWARKPIFNADGLLVGYTRPQYMCPQWY
jgi:hypothetical protein